MILFTMDYIILRISVSPFLGRRILRSRSCASNHCAAPFRAQGKSGRVKQKKLRIAGTRSMHVGFWRDWERKIQTPMSLLKPI